MQRPKVAFVYLTAYAAGFETHSTHRRQRFLTLSHYSGYHTCVSLELKYWSARIQERGKASIHSCKRKCFDSDLTTIFQFQEHLQNSTLAGGVAIGAVADKLASPFGAVLIGSAIGVVSVIGFRYIRVSIYCERKHIRANREYINKQTKYEYFILSFIGFDNRDSIYIFCVF